jgi:uncharacterized protein HemX
METTETEPFTPAPLPPAAAPKRKRGKTIVTIVGTLVAVLLVGGMSYSLFALSQAHSDVTALQHQVSSLKTEADNTSSSLSTVQGSQSSDESDISTIKAQVSTMQSQIANVNRPNDPLSSYNLVCTSNNTNSTTGVPQTFYYPCTNSASPTPGY